MTREQMKRLIERHPASSMPRIFEAAISGILANPEFLKHTDIVPVSVPELAVRMALDVCLASMSNGTDKDREEKANG